MMRRIKATTIFWTILGVGTQIVLIKSNLTAKFGGEPLDLGWFVAMTLISIPALIVLTRKGQQTAHQVRADHEAERARANPPESAPMIPSPRRLAFLVTVEAVLPMLIIANSMKLIYTVAVATDVDPMATKILMTVVAIAWGVFAYFHLKAKAEALPAASKSKP